tara:strand:- start:213 stop:470 length:258 start_codon:yes stop_codon:yes gene_type:complete
VELPIVEVVEVEENLVKIQVNKQVDLEVQVVVAMELQQLVQETLEDIVPQKVIQERQDQEQDPLETMVVAVEQEQLVQIHVVERD